MANDNLYNKGLFDDWVPRGLMLPLIIIFLFPIMTISGVFTGNMTDLSGYFGSYSEHIQMANNAISIGMALSLAIVMRVKMRFRSKEIVVGSTLMMAALVGICAVTSNIYIYIGANFLIGFLKMFPLLEVIIPVMFMLSPKGDKSRFYSIFYPIAIGSSTLISHIMSIYAFDYGISNLYYFNIISMLLIALLGTVFMHNKRFCFKLPLYQIDWISLLFVGISMMSLNYGLTFLKQLNWFNEPTVIWSLVISLLTFIYVIIRQTVLKRKVYDFKAFLKFKSVRFSLVLLTFQAIYLSSSSVFMQWTLGALGYNNMVNAELNLWTIPGLIVGGILGFVGFKKNWHIKYYIWTGFGALFLNILLTYLTIQPNMNIEMFYFPTFLKGLGMVILFIAVWFYATKDLGMPDGLGVISLLLLFRTFVSMAISGALIGYLNMQFQLDSIADMSNYWDANLLGPYAMQGYGSMMMSSILAGGKTLLGWLLWLFIPISVIVLLHDYGKPNQRRRVYIKKIIKGKSVKGYRFRSLAYDE
ncbi:MAG: hypothetical protein LC107_05805 [Chitinophagales bacterium]|nr:hypothetical protein [Chitinophagales bacterium]